MSHAAGRPQTIPGTLDEATLRGLLEAAPDAVVVVGDEGRIRFVNAQAEQLFGWPRQELLGEEVELLLPARFRPRHEAHRSRFFGSPSVRPMGAGLELAALHRDGREFPVEISLSPLETPGGMLVSAAIRDTTDRRLAEERFRALLESAPDAMVIVGADGHITLVNAQTEKLFGYTRSELIGAPVEMLIPDRFHAEHSGHRSRFFAAPSVRPMGAELDLYARHEDGREFPVEISLSPLETPEGPLVSAAIRDITERKIAEENRAQLVRAEAQRAEAEAAAERTRRLQEITDAALDMRDLDAVAHDLAERIPAIIGARSAVVVLRDATSGALVPRGGVATADECRELAERAVRAGARADDPDGTVAVPLRSGGEITGALVLRPGAGPFTPEQLQTVELAAERAGLALHRVRLFEREHRIAETLQRSLLPDHLPDIPGLDVAARYLPAAAGADVGGDWYDCLLLADGKVALVMGDVVGRGIKAAALVGRLRNALRAYASDGHPAAEVVNRLNRFIDDPGEQPMATLAYAELDLATRRLELVSAGHPPPLLRGPDGNVEPLDVGPSQPLGAFERTEYESHEFTVERGSALFLYTDGLVERRTEPISAGIARAAEALLAGGPADALCDRAIAELLGRDRGTDDVAVLVVGVPAELPAELDLRLPARASALVRLRQALRIWLGEQGVAPDVVGTILVTAGEAASNAIEHAYGPGDSWFRAQVRRHDGSVTVVISDEGKWRAPRGTNRGRGLMLMEAMAESVEVDRTPAGTTVKLEHAIG